MLDLDVKAVARFHGSLPPANETVTSIKPRIFIAHGRVDPFIAAERIKEFKEFKAGLDRGKADWKMSGTRHSFTNPEADPRGMEQLQYNPRADKRFWSAMMSMFDEVLK
jgi:dienelactone hydrolase